MKGRYRLLALDIDGTLVVEHDEISAPTREALHRAEASGIEVALCTGRRLRTAGRARESLGLDVAVICLGGALVMDRDGERLWQQAFPAPVFQRLAGFLRDRGRTAVAQRHSPKHESDFLIDGSQPWDRYAQAYQRNNADHAEWHADLAGEARDDVLVVGTFGPEQALRSLAREIEGTHPEVFRIHVMPGFVNEGFYCQITPLQTSKLTGLEALARSRGLGIEEVCACGDQTNDVEMLEGAGLGVAMGNATPAVQAVADRVTGRHDEDGLVAVVEHLLEGSELG